MLDLLVWITQLVTLSLLFVTLRNMRRLRDKVQVLNTNLQLLRSRQSTMKRHYGTDARIKSDSHARTTKRDSSDLEARGARISTAVHRKMSNVSDPDNN